MAKELTWAELLNYPLPAYSSGAVKTKEIIFALKQMLTGVIGPGGSGVWTVLSSSDGVGNVANSDLWVTSANIIRAGSGNHSWCRLGNTTLGMEIVIDVLGSYEHTPMGFWCAKTFGVAGTATARPTGVGEWGDVSMTGMTSTTQKLHDDAAGQVSQHFLLSTRGDFWYHSGYGAIGVCKLLDTKPFDLSPWASYFGGNGNLTTPNTAPLNRRSISAYGGTANGGGYDGIGAGIRCANYAGTTGISNDWAYSMSGIVWPTLCGNINADMSSEGPLDGIGTYFDSGDNLFLTFPAIVGICYYGSSTFKGRWPDMLLGPASLASNTISPLIGAQEWLKVGTVFLPFVGGMFT